MKSPSLLLFDLGGVLIESAAFESLGRLLPQPVYPDQIKERWLLSPSVRQFERGQSSALEFAESFVAEWNLAVSADAFLAEFETWPRTFFPGAKELIRELSRNYRVGCLSNSNFLHWAKFKDELDDLFDIALSSHSLGSVKPDRDIFITALRACNAEAHEIYFFDDCLANVRTALSLNINAFCVTGFTSLVHILRLHGLLAPAGTLGFADEIFAGENPHQCIDAG